MPRLFRDNGWIVAVGAILGALVFIVALRRDESLSRALAEALGLALLAMAVCGVGKRFAGGGEIAKVGAGPTSIEFVEAAEEPIRTVNERFDVQVGGLEERLYALEKESEESKKTSGLDEPHETNQDQ